MLGVGLALYGVGTILVRRSEPPIQGVHSWTRGVIDSPEELDIATRLDMIERLALLGEPWGHALLLSARSHDADKTVRAAAKAALSRESTLP